MWNRRKPADISASLRDLRRRVLRDGQPFFRVISDSFDSKDFAAFEDEPIKSLRNRAREYALDLASTRVGSTVFISERRELDGVQVLVNVSEVCFEDFCKW